MADIIAWNNDMDYACRFMPSLGAILAHGYFQPGPLEQNTTGAGWCLTIIAVAFALAYIRDCINMFTEDEWGDDIGNKQK